MRRGHWTPDDAYGPTPSRCQRTLPIDPWAAQQKKRILQSLVMVNPDAICVAVMICSQRRICQTKARRGSAAANIELIPSQSARGSCLQESWVELPVAVVRRLSQEIHLCASISRQGGITLCREAPGTVNESAIAIASKGESYAAPRLMNRPLDWHGRRERFGWRGALQRPFNPSPRPRSAV